MRKASPRSSATRARMARALLPGPSWCGLEARGRDGLHLPRRGGPDARFAVAGRGPALAMVMGTQRTGMLLRLEGVARAFPDRALFSGVDLTVNAGDRIGLIGPNGAGKS